MSCADTGPFDGGTYNSPTINEATIKDSTLSGASLTGSVALDSNAAKNVLETLQELSPTALTDNPKQSTDTDVPTIIVGEDRTVILGKPFKWIKCGDGMIPVFRAE